MFGMSKEEMKTMEKIIKKYGVGYIIKCTPDELAEIIMKEEKKENE